MRIFAVISLIFIVLGCGADSDTIEHPNTIGVEKERDSTYNALLSSLKYFRTIDFYSDKQELSDEQLLDLLISYMRADYEVIPGDDTSFSADVSTSYFSDMALGTENQHIHLIKYDSSKVLTQLNGYDPILDSSAYTRLLQNLAHISNGQFNPNAISEKTDDYGVTHIQFMIDTIPVEFTVKSPSGTAESGTNIEFDIDLIHQINRLWNPDRAHFYYHSSEEEEFGVPEMDIPPSSYTHYFFVVFLSPEQRNALKERVGLRLR